MHVNIQQDTYTREVLSMIGFRYWYCICGNASSSSTTLWFSDVNCSRIIFEVAALSSYSLMSIVYMIYRCHSPGLTLSNVQWHIYEYPLVLGRWVLDLAWAIQSWKTLISATRSEQNTINMYRLSINLYCIVLYCIVLCRRQTDIPDIPDLVKQIPQPSRNLSSCDINSYIAGIYNTHVNNCE